MTHSIRFSAAKRVCLIAMAGFLCRPALAADPSSETNDQLIATLQSAMKANPSTKARGNTEFASAIASGIAQGKYQDLERALMQLKVQLSADPGAVAAIEMLLTRFQAAEAAATAKRNDQATLIVKDLTDKFNAHAKPQEYDELLKRISDLASANAISASYGNPGELAWGQRIEDVRMFAADWQEYLFATEQGNAQQAAARLGQLIQLTSHFTAIPRSALLSLQFTPAAPNPAVVEAEQNAKNEKFAKLFVAEIDAAKVPSDLDAALARDGPSNRYGAQSFQGYSTKEFLRKWQDYLAAAQAGKDVEALKVLKELAGNSDSTYYPRSKILTRISGMEKATGVHSGTGLLMDPASLTLGNLRTLLQQIDALGVDPRFLYEHGEANLRTVVGRLASAVDQVRTGDLKSGVLANQFSGTSGLTTEQVGEYSEVLNRLFDQVTLEALPAYIDVPAALNPGPKERLAAYLDRLIGGAVAARDWRLAFRAVQVRSEIGPVAGDPDIENADLQGFRPMITAMAYEEASQWTSAVSGYLEALSSTSSHLPTKEIGDRLLRIQKEHPDDYARAKTQPDYPSLVAKLIELQRSVPVPPQMQRPRNLPPGMPGQPAGSGLPQVYPRPNPQALPSN
jgi:hypothetical protein